MMYFTKYMLVLVSIVAAPAIAAQNQKNYFPIGGENLEEKEISILEKEGFERSNFTPDKSDIFVLITKKGDDHLTFRLSEAMSYSVFTKEVGSKTCSYVTLNGTLRGLVILKEDILGDFIQCISEIEKK